MCCFLFTLTGLFGFVIMIEHNRAKMKFIAALCGDPTEI